MDVLLRTWRAIPWSHVLLAVRGRAMERGVAGCLLGILATCGLGQYLAHWGTSGPMERGLAAAVLVSLMTGFLIHRLSRFAWPLWLMLSATIAPIFPWWLDRINLAMTLVPDDLPTSDARLALLGFATAIISLGVPLSFWTATACSLCDESGPRPSLSAASWGCACGVLLNALCLGPLLGAEMTAIVCAGLGLALSYRATQRKTEIATKLWTPRSPAWWMCLPALFCCGGIWAVAQNQLQMLILPSAAMQQASWAVMIAGLAIGMRLASRSSSVCNWPVWGAVIGVLALSLQRWGFEFGLSFSLWSSAYLINVMVHQLALVALLAVMLLPISLAAGLLLGVPKSRALILGLMCFLCGQAVLRELLLTVVPQTLSIALLSCLSGLILLSFLNVELRPAVRWQTFAVASGLAGGLLAVVLQSNIDPSRPAKLLFSTQTFLAYRSAWDADLLPHLDDSRLVATSVGRQGSLTLWKSRGCDLLLREAGIPRSVIACRPDISPQASSEVLQTVFPLLVSQESRRILLLGSSGGVPLSTFLSFPVEHVTCVEPDASRIAMIRGPIASHQGTDPFDDERVRWDERPVELAAAMTDGGYDIILSSPPPSSTVAAMPQFTQEFYRNVSRKLSPDGLFCQRLEAVDFGPEPVQVVTRALQQAFGNVVAVEIGVGDLLFLATNSEAGLVPKDLPDRLETPHVRRVLAKCGWDWSMLLTLPAWDHAALAEFANDGPRQGNSAANCSLALSGPRDVLRWGPKLQEVQALLTKPRTAAAEVLTNDVEAAPPSRRARYLDWLGETVVSHDLLRRLSEVAAQSKIVHDNPDAFWLEYRKALRDELQQRPRTEIRQVAATDETERVLHREDEQRKAYFVALGVAGDLEQRNLESVYELQRFFEPHDPLVSLFARQEMAELLKYYGHPDPATELALRLHVIHFAPASDCSLRNVLVAAELLLESADAIPDPQTRFDTMNGLLQTIRNRWDVRSGAHVKSIRLAIQDTDRSMLVAERMVKAMDDLAANSQVEAPNWSARKEVVARVLLRPLRGYRAELQSMQRENKSKTDAVIQDAKKNYKS